MMDCWLTTLYKGRKCDSPLPVSRLFVACCSCETQKCSLLAICNPPNIPRRTPRLQWVRAFLIYLIILFFHTISTIIFNIFRFDFICLQFYFSLHRRNIFSPWNHLEIYFHSNFSSSGRIFFYFRNFTPRF